MAHHHLDDKNSLYYIHHAPTRAGAPTFYFVNALTGTTDHWEGAAGPALREAGLARSAITSGARSKAHSIRRLN